MIQVVAGSGAVSARAGAMSVVYILISRRLREKDLRRSHGTVSCRAQSRCSSTARGDPAVAARGLDHAVKAGAVGSGEDAAMASTKG